MKKILGFAAFALLLALTACQQDNSVEPTTIDLVSVEDENTLEYIDNTLDEMIDQVVETRDPGNDCLEITFLNPPGQFPNKVTFDFGDGCEGPHGHELSGKIVVKQSAPMGEPGAIRTVYHDDFSIDGVIISGTRRVENVSAGEETGLVFIRTIDITLTFPNGMTANRSGEQTITQVEGMETDVRFDDVFEITGQVTGTTRNGNTYTSIITEPLIRRLNCRWLTDGVVEHELTTSTEVLTRTIDFGYPNDGECDNLALVTLPDGTEKEIKIHRKWW